MTRAAVAELVDAIPASAIPVASDLPAPIIEPSQVASAAVEDGAARFVAGAVDAVLAAFRRGPEAKT
jgi:hypothetical protein